VAIKYLVPACPGWEERKMSNGKTKASEEQMAYAGVLNIGMWLGLALLIVTFFV
jgi:hypothetical protein